MDSHQKKSLVETIYQLTFSALKKNRVLFAPFLIFALLDLVGLIFIYLAPREPVISFLGPPIKAFWGESFLHYPFNFLLLSKLESFNRMGLYIIFGSLLTGAAVALVSEIHNGNGVTLIKSLRAAAKRYVSLLAVVLIVYLLFYLFAKIFAYFAAKYLFSRGIKLAILITMDFIAAILIQAVFVYAIPIIIIEKEGLIKSLRKSFALFRKLFIPTIALIGLPGLCYLPIQILQSDAPFLVNRFFPESVLLVAIVSVIISSFVVDLLVTVSTAILYLKNKEKI